MKVFMKSGKVCIYAFFILFLIVACTKTEYEVLSGQIIGHVVYSQNGISRVEVTMEGGDQLIKATTDEHGQFIINDLKSGSYNIIFSKKGYCQSKIIGYQFVGGNKPVGIHQAIYKLPNFQIDSLNVYIPTDLYYKPYVEVNLAFSSTVRNELVGCRYYLSNSPDVSFDNYILTDVKWWYGYVENLYFNLTIDTLKFPIGSDLYMISFPASGMDQSYTDLNTGKEIYTAINTNKPSNVVHFTVPPIGTW